MTTAKILVSLFAQFVQGDIKGGTHAHAYRMATIRSAVEQMYKGNYSPITEAAALTEGKSKKARAYHAGFATFGVVGSDTKKVDYVGKLDSAANKDVRAVIEQKTHASTAAFFVAFDAIMAEKAEPKAKTAPATPVAAPTATTETETDSAGSDDVARHNAAVQLDTAVLSIVNMLNTGMLTGEQLDMLGDAVRAAEGRALLAQPALQTA